MTVATPKRRAPDSVKVSEYWIVEPQARVIQVHVLQEGRYAPAGHFGRGQRARSVVLQGFEVAVEKVLPGVEEQE